MEEYVLLLFSPSKLKRAALSFIGENIPQFCCCVHYFIFSSKLNAARLSFEL